jgi:hypothetical protein
VRAAAAACNAVDARLVGDATSSLGDATSSLGDATSSLGDAKSSLGDAKSSLGGAKSSLGGDPSHVVELELWRRRVGHGDWHLAAVVRDKRSLVGMRLSDVESTLAPLLHATHARACAAQQAVGVEFNVSY